MTQRLFDSIDSMIGKTISGDHLNKMLNGFPLFRMLDYDEYADTTYYGANPLNKDKDKDKDKNKDKKDYQILTLRELANHREHKKYAQRVFVKPNAIIKIEANGFICHINNGGGMIPGIDRPIDDLLKDLFFELMDNQSDCSSVCVINEIIAIDGMLLRYIDKTHRTVEIMMSAVTQNGFAIRYIDQQDRTREMMISAIKSNWRSIIFIDQEFRDIELMEAAVCTNGLSIRNINPKFRTDDLIMMAIKQNGLAIQYIDQSVRIRIIGLIEEAIKQNWFSVKYLKTEINESLISEALRQHCCALDLIDEQYHTESVQHIASITAERIKCVHHNYNHDES